MSFFILTFGFAIGLGFLYWNIGISIFLVVLGWYPSFFISGDES